MLVWFYRLSIISDIAYYPLYSFDEEIPECPTISYNLNRMPGSPQCFNTLFSNYFQNFKVNVYALFSTLEVAAYNVKIHKYHY